MPLAPKVPGSVEIFCSYSHADETLRKKFDPHVENLKRNQFIEFWHDRVIPAGADWKAEIDEHLDSADIIALFVSPDFLGSNYCYDIELKRAMERESRQEVAVLPILVRPCVWEDAPFARLQLIPNNAKPITTWKNRDLAWTEVAKQLKIAIRDVLKRQQAKLSSGLEPPHYIDTPMGRLYAAPADQQREAQRIATEIAAEGQRWNANLQSKIFAITEDLQRTRFPKKTAEAAFKAMDGYIAEK